MKHPIQLTLELEDVDILLEALQERVCILDFEDRQRIATEIHLQAYL